MHTRHIDIYLLQETWLTKDWETTINGIQIFYHGPDKATCNRGTGGVAIMLSTKAQAAWTAAGRPTLLRPGTEVDNTTRVMGIELLIQGATKQQKRVFVMNIYAPTTDHEIKTPGITEKFYTSLQQHIHKHTSPSSHTIVGGDWNAKIGKRKLDEEDAPYLGPTGLPQ